VARLRRSGPVETPLAEQRDPADAGARVAAPFTRPGVRASGRGFLFLVPWSGLSGRLSPLCRSVANSIYGCS